MQRRGASPGYFIHGGTVCDSHLHQESVSPSGSAILLTAFFLGVLLAAPTAPGWHLIDLDPVPPRSIVPGTSETFTWNITGGTAQRVESNQKPRRHRRGFTYVPQQQRPRSHPLLHPGGERPTGPLLERGTLFQDGRRHAHRGRKLLRSERGNLHVYKFDDFNGNHEAGPGEGPVADDHRDRRGAGFAVPERSIPPAHHCDRLGEMGWHRRGHLTFSETVPLGREPTLPISRTVDVRIGETTVITFANRLPRQPRPRESMV